MITSTGEVWSIIRQKFLKKTLDAHGYYVMGLYEGQSKSTFKLHRLVALHFIDNPNGYPVVDHIDRNKLNNDSSNLRWASSTTNARNHNLSKANTTGYHGVSIAKKSQRYQAIIYANRKQIYLGTYDTPQQAALAYNDKAKELGFDNLNVI